MKELELLKPVSVCIHCFEDIRGNIHKPREITKRKHKIYLHTKGKGKMELNEWLEQIREGARKIGEEDILDMLIEYTKYGDRYLKMKPRDYNQDVLYRATSSYVTRLYESDNYVGKQEFYAMYLKNRKSPEEVIEIVEVDTKIYDGPGKKIDVKQSYFNIPIEIKEEEEQIRKDYDNAEQIIKTICDKIKKMWGNGSAIKFIISRERGRLRVDLDVGIDGIFVNMVENAFDEELKDNITNREFLWKQCSNFRKIASTHNMIAQIEEKWE